MTMAHVSISFIQNPRPGQTPGTRLEGNKTSFSRDNHLVQNPSPSGQNKESKTTPLGQSIYKYINKFLTLFEMKALWSQQIKQFFNEETDCYSIYHLAVTRVKLLNVQIPGGGGGYG